MRKVFFFLSLVIVFLESNSQSVPSYVPTNGLVAWYPFNGNANDESGNGNHGTVNGAMLTADRFGSFNSAYSFNANADVITCNSSSFQNQEFTITGWCKLISGFSYTTINMVEYGPNNNSSPGGYGLRLDQNDAVCGTGNYQTYGYISDATNGIFVNQVSPYINSSTASNWNHYVITKDNDSIRIYMNNFLLKKLSSQTLTISFSNAILQFGNQQNLNNNPAGNRQLDDIGIWDRALSQQEISNLYNASVPPSCPGLPSNLQTGLVGYWPFCGNANDESGNGNNGMVNGAMLTTDRFGSSQNAYEFDPTNTIVVPHSSLLNIRPNFSVSLWYKSNSTYFAQDLVMKGADYNVNAWWIRHHTYAQDPNTNFAYNPDAYGAIQVGAPFPQINNWTHILAIVDGSVMKIYKNGSLQLTSSIVDFTTANLNTHNLVFGTTQYGFSGSLDDIAIWNRALTQQEITQVYTSSVCPTSYNLFPQDTIRACGSSYTLDAGSDYTSYSWSTGATTQSINVTSTGWYKCTVNNGSCSSADSVFVSLVNADIVNNDTTICPGNSIYLTAMDKQDSVVIDIDGNTYRTVTIGNQTWLKQNLAVSRFNNGDDIPYCLSPGPSFYGVWAYPMGVVSNEYGKLYEREVLLDPRGLAPKGWRIPADSDWNKLITYLDPLFNGIYSATAGNKLKEQGCSHWWCSNDSGFSFATNESGFSAYAAGCLYGRLPDYPIPFYEGQGIYAVFWSIDGGSILLQYDSGSVLKNGGFVGGNSVRCIKNTPTYYLWSNGATTPSITVSPEQTTKYYVTISNGISSCRDSITVTVIGNSTQTTSTSACNSYTWNGVTYTESGIYTWTGINYLGCDSIAYLQLIIKQPTESYNYVSACGSYLWNGTNYYQSGVYSFMTVNATGCDSTAYLNLTVNGSSNFFPADTIRACGTSYLLDAGSGAYAYNWSTGATSQTVHVYLSGLYRCTRSQWGCTISDTVYVSLVNADIINNDTTICQGSNLRLFASVSTGGPDVSDIEGNVYPSFTTACGQTWTSANLNVSRYRNGDIIPQVTDDAQWANITTGAWCWYRNDSARYWKYGKLYNWYALSDSRGLAPAGWHVPANTEWNQLLYCIDPSADTSCANCNQTCLASDILKMARGFSGMIYGGRLPGGNWWSSGSCGNCYGMWWTVSESNYSNAAWIRYLSFGCGLNKSAQGNNSGFNIRLVKNNTNFLNSGASNLSYLWSTGSISPIVNNIPVWSPSRYYLTVSNGINSCRDSVFVDVIPRITPTFTQLAPVCSGNSFYLPATSENGIRGTWSPAINRTQTTTYTFTPTSGQCSFNTTMTVVVNPNTSSNTYVSVCANQLPYVWNNSYYFQSGLYSYVTLNAQGCDSTAYLNLTVIGSTNFLGTDTIPVCGTSYVLDAGSGASAYGWSTGDTSRTINVFISGLYRCTRSQGGCSISDTVFISLFNNQIINNDSAICTGNSVTLSTIAGNNSSNANLYSASLDVIDIDGNVYPSINMSSGQIWTTKNLTVSRYRNGDVIPQVTDPTTWRNLTTGAWCWYNNDSANYWQYGKLYNWYAVNDSRGLTPFGWHISTNTDWYKMTKYLDATVDTTDTRGWSGSTIGNQLKNSSGWIDGTGTNGSNSSGFSGIPAGARHDIDGAFIGNRYEGLWWSASEYDSSTAWFRGMKYSSNGYIYKSNYNKSWGFSLRMLRDANYLDPYYLWSSGATTSSITVSPAQTTTYYLTASNGINSCLDSVKITVNQPSNSSSTVTACNNYSWNGVTYTQAGTYAWTGTNMAGCDSTATLNLLIDQQNAVPAGPLSGLDYYIPGQGCNGFPSIDSAVKYLNANGIIGNVNFNIAAGYVESITSRISLGSSTLNASLSGKTLTFQRAGVGANPLIRSVYTGVAVPGLASGNINTPDGIWSLNGVDNVIIDGIDLLDASTGNNMEYGYGLFKGGITVIASSGSTGKTINVQSTANITVGSSVWVSSGTGSIKSGSKVTAINNATQFTIDSVLTTAPAAGSVIAIIYPNDGAQNNTIKNCTITLNRNNSATGATVLFDGSVGITMNNMAAAAAGLTYTPTTSAGANSFNRFLSNTIQNCNTGIGLSGYASATALQFAVSDTLNAVGGFTSGSGNTIIGFGGGTSAGSTAVGIRIRDQRSCVIINNVIRNDSTGINHPSSVKGIATSGGPSASISIIGNRVFATCNSSTAAVVGIENALGTSGNNILIQRNTVSGSHPAATSGTWTGILNTARASMVQIRNNVLRGFVSPASSSGAINGIQNTAALNSGSLNIDSNVVANNIIGGSGIGKTLIAVGSPQSGSAVTINNNIIKDNNYATTGGLAATMNCVLQTGSAAYSFNKNIIDSNRITGISGTAVATLYGYFNNGAVQLSETVSANTISNLFITGSSSGQHVINGIRNNPGSSLSASRWITDNTIYNLFTNDTSSVNLIALHSNAGGSNTISGNRIYNLFPGQKSGVSSLARGILITSGWNNRLYNNMISIDLNKARVSTSFVAGSNVLNGNDQVKGIEITSTLANSFCDVFHNSVCLSGTGKSNFGSSAFSHTSNATATTSRLDLRNNILVNQCIPLGTGLVVAFRKSGTALANDSVTTNFNLYYAGAVQSSPRILYSDGTNNLATLSALVAFRTPRDVNSISVLPQFIDTAADLHLTTSNCYVGDMGTPSASVTIDIDGAARSAIAPDIGADEFTGSGGSISGNFTLCTNTTTQLTGSGISDSIQPWISSNSAVATVSTTGLVFGVSPGMAVITYKASNGCAVSRDVTVNSSIILTSQPLSPAAVCAGTNTRTVLRVAAVGTGLAYQWLKNDVHISSATLDSFVIANPVASDSGWYKVLVARAGCSSLSSDSVRLRVNPLPSITHALPWVSDSLCFSSASQTTGLAYTGTAGGSSFTYSIVWNLQAVIASFTPVSSQPFSDTTIGIAVPAGAPANTYRGLFRLTNISTGCISAGTTADSFSIVVKPLPGIATQPSATDQSRCLNVAFNPLSVQISSGIPQYQWYSNSTAGNVGGTLIGSAVSASYSPPSSVAGNSYYYAVVRNQSTGCSRASNVSGLHTVNPLPAITASASTASVCALTAAQNTILNYSATSNAPNQYSIIWNNSPANSFTNISNATLPAGQISIAIPANTASGTYTGTITVRNTSTTCVSNPGNTFTVPVGLVSVIASALPSSVCSGASASLVSNANGKAPFTYTWSDGNGVVGSSSQSITVNPAATTQYSLTVTDNCGATATDTVLVWVNTPPVVSIAQSGPISLCSGQSVVLSAQTNSIAPVFQWSLNDATINAGVSSVNYSATQAGNYKVSVVDTITGCQSTSVGVQVNTCLINLNVKAYLEGYYRSSVNQMASTLYDLGESFNPAATDTIRVDLWSEGNLSNATADYSVKALLHTDGTATAEFPGSIIGNSYYIAIRHRNSVETWSAHPVNITTVTNYDFTNDLSKAYDDGINPPMKQLAVGRYGLYAGDVNQDGTPDALDMNAVYNDAIFYLFGYNNTDCDGDGETGVLDMNLIFNNSILYLFYARPY